MQTGDFILFWYFLLGVFWASQIFGLVSVNNFQTFFSIIASNISLFSLFSFYYSRYECVLRFEIIPDFFNILPPPSLFSYFFSLYFTVSTFCSTTFQLTGSLLRYVLLTGKPSHQRHSWFLSKWIIFKFLAFSGFFLNFYSLPTSHIVACCLLFPLESVSTYYSHFEFSVCTEGKFSIMPWLNFIFWVVLCPWDVFISC